MSFYCAAKKRKSGQVRLKVWRMEKKGSLGAALRETEKPKVSGNSAKSLFRRVDFPVPEGPDTTTGRYFWTIYRESQT